MIEKLSHFLAVKIHAADPEKKESVEVLSYSLSITLNYLLILFFSLLIGFLTNKFTETIVAMISFIALRIFSKGYHAKTLTTCFVLTTAIIAVIPHVPVREYTSITNILNVILVLIFAPNGSYEEGTISNDRARLLKAASIVVVASNFLMLSQVVALSFFIQSLLLIPKRR